MTFLAMLIYFAFVALCLHLVLACVLIDIGADNDEYTRFGSTIGADGVRAKGEGP